LVFFTPGSGHCQGESPSGFWVSANTHYGFVIAHNQNMQYMIQGHVPGGEVNFFKTTDGSKAWQRAYQNPEIGISVFYLYLANPVQLGFGMSINPYVNFPLV